MKFSRRKPLKLQIFAILAAGMCWANATLIIVDDTAVSGVTLTNVTGTSLSSPGLSTVTLGTGSATFSDLTGGVSYYRVPVAGLSGDTVSFRIQVNQLFDDNGSAAPNPAYLTGGFIVDDFYLVDTSGGTPTIIGSSINSTADPFDTQPGSITIQGSSPSVLGPFFDESFTAGADFDEVLIRAEFWGGNQTLAGTQVESILIGIPEPSSFLVLGGAILGLLLRRKRRALC